LTAEIAKRKTRERKEKLAGVAFFASSEGFFAISAVKGFVYLGYFLALWAG
jgi:hypothetical protein